MEEKSIGGVDLIILGDHISYFVSMGPGVGEKHQFGEISKSRSWKKIRCLEEKTMCYGVFIKEIEDKLDLIEEKLEEIKERTHKIVNNNDLKFST